MNPSRTLMTVLCLLVIVAAHSEARRSALVLGNAAYPGTAALRNPANDATDMAAALERSGWSVRVLVNGDRRAMLQTLASWSDDLNRAPVDQALFYYAGHGIQFEATNYLIPIGSEFDSPTQVRTDGIDLGEVLKAMDHPGVGSRLVILDACRDNPFAKDKSRSATGGSRGLSALQAPGVGGGSAVVFSTGPGDVAQDGAGRNGVFTAALLKHLETPLTVEQMIRKVTSEVRLVTGGKQNPWINSSLTSEFYFMSDSQREARDRATRGTSPGSVGPATLTLQTTVGQKGSLLLRARPVTDEAARTIPVVLRTVQPFQAYASLERPENFLAGNTPLEVGTTVLSPGPWLVSGQREDDTQESWYQVVTLQRGSDTSLTVPLVGHSGPYRLAEAQTARATLQDSLGWSRLARGSLDTLGWTFSIFGTAFTSMGALQLRFAVESSSIDNARGIIVMGGTSLALAVGAFLWPTNTADLERQAVKLDQQILTLQPPRSKENRP